MRLAWGKKVDVAFREKLFDVCLSLGWSPDPFASNLMSCIAFESGGTFSPSIRNAAGSGAVGLIQFMPATAKGLGTTTEALAQMSAVEQLDYVRKYFLPYAKRIKNLPDLYMAILMPKYVGQPDNSILFSGGVAYRQNSGLDVNKDGSITKLEAASLVQRKLSQGLSDTYALEI